MSNFSDVKEQLRSPLTWHAVVAVLLFAVVLVLGIRVAFDWIDVSASKSDELQKRQSQLLILENRTAPLRGLDKKVELSRTEIKDFLSKRVPANYSTIAIHLGDVAVKNSVRLTRVAYGKGKPSDSLTEVPIDASISGDYTGILRFINGLERDENFFVVRGMALTGQQGGTVNLRLQVSTWMRPSDAANAPEDKSGKPEGGTKDAGDDTDKDGGKSPATNKSKGGK
jgi:Tfp pilus assembly protein PilO